MSLGSYCPSSDVQGAVNYAHDGGVALFAAAGNDGASTMIYLAGCQNVIGVGVTTNQDQKASFSNFSSSVDVTAPGKDVYSMSMGGGYAFGSGTSAATPTAAGVAALVISCKPSLSPSRPRS
jgi:subtilisin family serine protease